MKTEVTAILVDPEMQTLAEIQLPIVPVEPGSSELILDIDFVCDVLGFTSFDLQPLDSAHHAMILHPEAARGQPWKTLWAWSNTSRLPGKFAGRALICGGGDTSKAIPENVAPSLVRKLVSFVPADTE